MRRKDQNGWKGILFYLVLATYTIYKPLFLWNLSFKNAFLNLYIVLMELNKMRSPSICNAFCYNHAKF